MIKQKSVGLYLSKVITIKIGLTGTVNQYIRDLDGETRRLIPQLRNSTNSASVTCFAFNEERLVFTTPQILFTIFRNEMDTTYKAGKHLYLLRKREHALIVVLFRGSAGR